MCCEAPLRLCVEVCERANLIKHTSIKVEYGKILFRNTSKQKIMKKIEARTLACN